ncbi:secreted protein [Candidatus Omnitrophus magneticus]|uniref:Secreted protein n=1 Tax=Candidatus Omnitrophus magneticus TaxID=1609969 RepID=A0A0F0CQU1_9BACT|nr:secreted protein [Candidatus Omnitrophus magneticus]
MKLNQSYKIINIIFILIFTSNQLFVSADDVQGVYSILGRGGDFLAPPLKFNSLFSAGKDSIDNSNFVTFFSAYFLNGEISKYSVLSDIDEKDVFSVIDGKKIFLLVSKRAVSTEGEITKISFPCLLEGQKYLIIVSARGNELTDLQVKSEQDAVKILKDFSWERTASASLSDTHPSVRFILAFFEKIGASKLRNRVKDFIHEERIVFFKDEPLDFDGIVFKYNENLSSKDFTLSLIKEITSYFYDGLSELSKNVLKKSMDDFWEIYFTEGKVKIDKEKDFDVKFKAETSEDSIDLINLVYSLESRVGPATNEGEIFKNTPVYEMIDLRDVDSNSSEYAETLDGIVNIFEQVAGHEAEVFNAENEGSNIKIFPRAIIPKKILVEKISNVIFPVSQSYEDGRIILNENFVKLMHKLRNMGFDTEYGDIYPFERLEESAPIGNFYNSLIHAIAILELRGHFFIDKETGKIAFHYNETSSQSNRGKNYLYVNLLSLVYFWLNIVEGAERFSSDSIERFMKENYVVFKNLSAEEKKNFAEHLLALENSFIELYSAGSLTRYPVWMDEETFLNTSFKKEEADITKLIEIFYSIAGPLDFSALMNEFRIRDLYITRKTARMYLKVLYKSGLLNLIFVGNEEIDSNNFVFKNYLYNMVHMTGKDLKEIRGCLKKASPNGRVRNIPAKNLEEEITRIREKYYAGVFIKDLNEIIYNKKFRENKEEIIIAIDTSWIPEKLEEGIQPLLQSFDKLEELGCIKVIRGRGTAFIDELNRKSVGVPFKNILILAGKEISIDPYFTQFWLKAGTGDNRPFIAYIEAGDLQNRYEYFFLQFVQIMDISIKMAFLKSYPYQYSQININVLNSKRIELTLFAKKIDIRIAKTIYDAQKKIIQSL